MDLSTILNSASIQQLIPEKQPSTDQADKNLSKVQKHNELKQ